MDRPIPDPLFSSEAQLEPARPYGARSDESIVVGDLLMQHVPVLASGDLEILGIARQARAAAGKAAPCP